MDSPERAALLVGASAHLFDVEAADNPAGTPCLGAADDAATAGPAVLPSVDLVSVPDASSGSAAMALVPRCCVAWVLALVRGV